MPKETRHYRYLNLLEAKISPKINTLTLFLEISLLQKKSELFETQDFSANLHVNEQLLNDNELLKLLQK